MDKLTSYTDIVVFQATDIPYNNAAGKSIYDLAMADAKVVARIGNRKVIEFEIEADAAALRYSDNYSLRANAYRTLLTGQTRIFSLREMRSMVLNMDGTSGAQTCKIELHLSGEA